jgi:hypothetical protein
MNYNEQQGVGGYIMKISNIDYSNKKQPSFNAKFGKVKLPQYVFQDKFLSKFDDAEIEIIEHPKCIPIIYLTHNYSNNLVKEKEVDEIKQLVHEMGEPNDIVDIEFTPWDGTTTAFVTLHRNGVPIEKSQKHYPLFFNDNDKSGSPAVTLIKVLKDLKQIASPEWQQKLIAEMQKLSKKIEVSKKVAENIPNLEEELQEKQKLLLDLTS